MQDEMDKGDQTNKKRKQVVRIMGSELRSLRYTGSGRVSEWGTHRLQNNDRIRITETEVCY
jgi:hypothetical protein